MKPEKKPDPRPGYSAIALCLIAFSMVFWAGRLRHSNVTSWDVLGYYLYLPQTFIEHDPGNADVQHLEAMRQKYELGPSVRMMMYESNKGYHLSQYGFGMAIFYLPAFVTGHVFAKISGYPANGYSLPYQYSIVWWQVFYMVLSCVVLRKVLRLFFNDRIVSLLLVTVCFGTNY